MAKWKISVTTDGNYYEYNTDSDKQKTDIIRREKAKPVVASISVNNVRCYKRK